MRFTKAKALLVVLVMIAGLAALVRPALAQGGCLPDVGRRLTVIFAHGLSGDSDLWGSEDDPNSMIGQVKGLTGSVESFSYKTTNKQWVIHPEIGPKLAERIACAAQSSREQGGTGKVVVIAHSMGGLATRYAASLKVNGHLVADDIGMVVMIATPNTGSSVADWAINAAQAICNTSSLAPPAGMPCDAALRGILANLSAMPALKTGSRELADLPWLPRNIPVLAIAGNITQRIESLFGNFELPASGSDSYVDVNSALRGKEVNGLGGNKEISCTDAAPVLPLLSNASCAHGYLVRNPQVQQWVVDAIKAYQQKAEQKPATSAPAPPANPAGQGSVTFGDMTLQLAKNWKVENNPDGRVFIIGKGYCTPSQECPRLEITKIQPDSAPPWGQYLPCGSEGNATAKYPLEFKELFQMGAKRAAYHEQKNCTAPPGNVYRYWALPKSGILLSTGALRGPQIDDIYWMLRSATWK